MQRHELAGRRFGRMVVTAFHGVVETPGGTRRTTWLCRCDCGAEKVVRGQDLVSGVVASCGCLRDEKLSALATKHRQSGGGSTVRSREYEAWSHAKQRCTNANDSHFRHYGGRGITMCARWFTSFEAFMSDMGPCPDGFELDRRDVNGHYEPGNCRWASIPMQALNKRNTRYVEMHDGSRRPLMEVCRAMGVDYYVVHGRLRRGWSLGEAVAIPTDRTRLAA